MAKEELEGHRGGSGEGKQGPHHLVSLTSGLVKEMAVLDPTRPIQVGLKQSVCAQSRPTLCSPMEACEAPLSMGFSRQEYWYGLSDPPIVVLPDPGVESSSLASSALVGGFFTTSATWEA